MKGDQKDNRTMVDHAEATRIATIQYRRALQCKSVRASKAEWINNRVEEIMTNGALDSEKKS